MSKKINLDEDIKELFNAFSKIESFDERKAFFCDLLSPEELKDIARRWKVAKMLANRVPFSTIEEETGMSSTTIARISKWLKKGYGGLEILVKK